MSTTNDTTLEEYIIQQAEHTAEINTFISNYRKTSRARHTLGYITGRLEGIEESWKKFSTTHQIILNTAKAESRKGKYFTENQFSLTKEKYCDFRGELLDILASLNTTTTSPVNQSFAPIREEVALPRINIPRFGGDYHLWQPFHDLFNTMINSSQSLSNVQKLHYLKSCVVGEAEQLLRQFQITSNNYVKAWELLKRRYDNKRLMVNTILNRMMSQPMVSGESSKGIKALLDTTNECIQALTNVKIITESWDAIIVFTVVQRLPTETHKLWEQGLPTQSKELPTFAELTAFLENRFQTLEAVRNHATVLKPATPPNRSRPEHRTQAFIATLKLQCPVCRRNHATYQCPKFRSMDITVRQRQTKALALCFNCLATGHSMSNCTSKGVCRKCGMNHHTMLHQNPTTTNSGKRITSKHCQLAEQTEQTTGVCDKTNQSVRQTTVLLATALIQVRASNGNFQVFRAVVDPESQETFITEAATRRLQLKKHRSKTRIFGLGESQAETAPKEVHIEVRSYKNANFQLKTKALILKKLTKVLPSQQASIKQWTHIKNLDLADPQFFESNKIDLLLGADVTDQILLDGVRKGPAGTPIAQNTTLGWRVAGKGQKQNRTYDCTCKLRSKSYFTYPTSRDHFSDVRSDTLEGKCTLSEQTFNSVKSLRRHLQSHSGAKPNACTQNTKRKTHLVQHRLGIHDSQPMSKGQGKRFVNYNRKLAPVDNFPTPAKESRKSFNNLKASSASISSAARTTPKTASDHFTTPQFKAQRKIHYQHENLLSQQQQQQAPQPHMEPQQLQQLRLQQQHQQQTHLHQNRQSSQFQSTPDWHNMNFNTSAASVVNPNEFMSHPIAEESQPDPPRDAADSFNSWTANNQQFNFNNKVNIETNTGGMLTNLKILNNNLKINFNENEKLNTQRLQHHHYNQQEIDCNRVVPCQNLKTANHRYIKGFIEIILTRTFFYFWTFIMEASNIFRKATVSTEITLSPGKRLIETDLSAARDNRKPKTIKIRHLYKMSKPSTTSAVMQKPIMQPLSAAQFPIISRPAISEDRSHKGITLNPNALIMEGGILWREFQVRIPEQQIQNRLHSRGRRDFRLNSPVGPIHFFRAASGDIVQKKQQPTFEDRNKGAESQS